VKREGWEGRFYEDFEVGEVYRCRFGRTVTEYDNISFTLLTNNTNQIHFNRDYGERTSYGACLVNSMLTLAIVVGMSSPDVSENGVNLGWEEIRMREPVVAGDTLYSETEVLAVRESQSRPEQGIVTVRTRGYNQRGQLVIDLKRSILVWKREHAPARDIFPTIQQS
jgi:acyl dehydratase